MDGFTLIIGLITYGLTMIAKWCIPVAIYYVLTKWIVKQAIREEKAREAKIKENPDKSEA